MLDIEIVLWESQKYAQNYLNICSFGSVFPANYSQNITVNITYNIDDNTNNSVPRVYGYFPPHKRLNPVFMNFDKLFFTIKIEFHDILIHPFNEFW